jgi:hypothetical protein
VATLSHDGTIVVNGSSRRMIVEILVTLTVVKTRYRLIFVTWPKNANPLCAK